MTTEEVLLLARAKRARLDLYHFILEFMPVCDPMTYVDGKVVKFLAETFMYAVRRLLPDDVKKHWMSDEEYNNQLLELKENHINISDLREKDTNYYNINIPPGHMKSLILNVLGPCWLFGLAPTRSTAISHTDDLSTEMNLKRQKVLNSDKWHQFYPEIWLTKNEGRLLIGNHFGELYSINTSAFTGRSSELIVNDDLISAKQARMDKQAMKNAIDFYRDTMPSRIRDQKRGVIMNVQQRLAPGDVTGMILEDKDLSKLYNHIALQAISTYDRVIIHPVSGLVWEIKEGEPLWPERFDNYANLKATQGSAVFETQYQQNPLSSEDTIVKMDMIKYVTPAEVQHILDEPDYVYASTDLAVKDGKDNDFLGSVLAKQRGNTLVIMDVLEKRMAYVASKRYITNLATVHRGLIHLIEDAANGAQAIQELQGSIPGIVDIRPGSNSKIMRLETATVPMESGNVVFLTDEFGQPSEAVENLVDRLLKVPFVKHMDIVDAFTQLVNYVYINKTFGMFDKAFDEKNLVQEQDLNLFQYKESTFSVIRRGTTWMMLRVHYDYRDDIVYVMDELVIRSDDMTALQKLSAFAGNSTIVDASKNEHIYNMFSSRLNIIPNTDERDIMEQLSQLNSGFSMSKIIISRQCVELRRDIDNIMLDKDAIQKTGQMKLKNDEGLVACLRSIIYMVKGSGDFFTF